MVGGEFRVKGGVRASGTVRGTVRGRVGMEVGMRLCIWEKNNDKHCVNKKYRPNPITPNCHCALVFLPNT